MEHLLHILNIPQQIVQLLHLVIELGQQQPGVLLRHGRLILLHTVTTESAAKLPGHRVEQLVGLGERKFRQN